MAEQARVILLRGSGSERLRDAMAQGLAEGDLRRDIDQTIRENDRLKLDVARLTAERNMYREVVREDRKTRVAAYRERIERRDAWRDGADHRAAIRALTLLGGIIALGVLSMAIGWWSV
jgi:hypothetical protein